MVVIAIARLIKNIISIAFSDNIYVCKYHQNNTERTFTSIYGNEIFEINIYSICNCLGEQSRKIYKPWHYGYNNEKQYLQYFEASSGCVGNYLSLPRQLHIDI